MKKAIALIAIITSVVLCIIVAQIVLSPGVVRISSLPAAASAVPDEVVYLPDQQHFSEPGGLERDRDGMLIGSAVFDEPIILKGTAQLINVREAADITSLLVTRISLGQKVEATEVVDGWFKVTVLPGMDTGFIRSDLLADYCEDTQYFAETLYDSILWRGVNTDVTLVDVRAVVADIETYLIFATPDNFTGRTLYARDVPLLQEGTAEKLRAAQEIFAQDGYRIKLYDAYRPSGVSGTLFSIIRDSRYIAPAGTSMHNRAAAVDITLVDADGNELEMPSPMHTFNRSSHRDSSMSAEARRNMNYMTSVMRQSGFTTIQSEWWHFNDSQASRYPPLDFSFAELTFYSVDTAVREQGSE